MKLNDIPESEADVGKELMHVTTLLGYIHVYLFMLNAHRHHGCTRVIF